MPQQSFEELLDQAAAACGIDPGYWDIWGNQHRTTPDVTQAILASLGIASDTPENLEGSLAERTRAEFAKINKKDGETYWRMWKESEHIDPSAKFWQRRLAMSHWEIIRDNFVDDHCRCFMLACPWSQ